MNQQIISNSGSSATRAIYDQYAGLLYGYIYEVVKDKQIAEQYLLSVFNDLPQHLQDVLQPGVNTYNRLQQMARRSLNSFFETVPDCPPADNVPARPNKFLSRMNAEQQIVFCNIHYNGKSIGKLAAELDKGEDEIRKILQQAFAAIRRAA